MLDSAGEFETISGEHYINTPTNTSRYLSLHIYYIDDIPRWHFHLLLLIVLFLSFVISRHFCRNCCALLFCTIFVVVVVVAVRSTRSSNYSHQLL